MKHFLIFIVILITFLSFGCGAKDCDKNIKIWISEAPTALNDFLMVKEEILSSKDFIDSFSRQGVLFIGGAVLDTNRFAGFNMPKLKGWFKNGRGYINFEKNDTSACFKECDNGSHSAYGIIRLGPIDRTKYNSAVKIVDTLKLKDDWNAEVTKCNGCGS